MPGKRFILERVVWPLAQLINTPKHQDKPWTGGRIGRNTEPHCALTANQPVEKCTLFNILWIVFIFFAT